MSAYTPLLFLFGLAAGTTGTMVGVGMGFVHVPLLILLFGFTPQAAVATSIAIIFMNTLSGSIIYYHQGRLDVGLASKLSLAVLPGAIIGPFIVEEYSSDAFSLLFAGVLLVSALNLMLGGSPSPAFAHNGPGRRSVSGGSVSGGSVSGRSVTGRAHAKTGTNIELGFIGTLLIGFLSNLLGVGGGIIHVPFLILVLKLPTHVAIGTAHLLLCVSSFVGTVVFALLGHVNVDFAIPMGIGAIVGASFGADLARKMQAVVLRRVLAFLVIFVGVTMVLDAT